MKKLLIAGAGGCGREVYQWTVHIQAVNRRWDTVEFIDDNLHALDNYKLYSRITGTIRAYIPRDDEFVVCAIGDSRLRMEINTELSQRGAQFASIIHPTALLADSCTLGKGIILCPKVIISTNVKIDDFVLINSSSFIGHDSVVEKGCTVSGHCNVMGFAHIEEGGFLGGGAQILPGVRVGRYARVGAGAIVVSNVEEETTVYGNPAKRLMYRGGQV